MEEIDRNNNQQTIRNIPRMKAGKKYLINFDTLPDDFAQPGEEVYAEEAQGAD